MHTTSSASDHASTPVGGGAPAHVDLETQLSLVGHVVQDLGLRVPSHVDRSAMFNFGAMGLVIAARRQDASSGNFASQAMRAIRASIIGNLGSPGPAPTDHELSELLAIPVLVLRAARAAAAQTAPPSPPATMKPAPRPMLAAPAFIGAH